MRSSCAAACLIVVAFVATGCDDDEEPAIDAVAGVDVTRRDLTLPDAAADLQLHDAAADSAAPDAVAAPADPVVYGSYEHVGNPVCQQIHPPATKPCQQHSLTWLQDIYGIRFTRASAAEVSQAGAVYRLVELAEREGPVAIEIWVVDQDGKLLPNTKVNVCYPCVDSAGTLGCSANNVPLTVKPEGHGDFTMTGSGYIACGQLGPYAAWVDDPPLPSDRVYGLGMLVGTNHRHMNLLFQRVSLGQPSVDATRCPLAEP